MARCPAILIAAPASGQGKTTVACALARLHARQGRRVRVFKCGPDFLDPYWLTLASGAPVHQLDLWMTGEADDAQRLDLPADVLQGHTIAVARDGAFCFLYAANIDCLQAMGAELVYFSPLQDRALPPCDALWLPGGYPGLHAQTLAGNAAMKSSITRHVQAGKPVWTECGGMMALFDQLTDIEGISHPMWGVLPGSVTMQKRLAALGPQQLEVAGGVLPGHTFHYSTCATPLQAASRTRAAPGRTLRGEGEALYVSGSVKASYFHAWFASSPAAAARLLLKEDHD